MKTNQITNYPLQFTFKQGIEAASGRIGRTTSAIPNTHRIYKLKSCLQKES